MPKCLSSGQLDANCVTFYMVYDADLSRILDKILMYCAYIVSDGIVVGLGDGLLVMALRNTHSNSRVSMVMQCPPQIV